MVKRFWLVSWVGFCLEHGWLQSKIVGVLLVWEKVRGFGFCGWCGMLKTVMSSSVFVFVFALAGKRVIWFLCATCLISNSTTFFGRVCVDTCLGV